MFTNPSLIALMLFKCKKKRKTDENTWIFPLFRKINRLKWYWIMLSIKSHFNTPIFSVSQYIYAKGYSGYGFPHFQYWNSADNNRKKSKNHSAEEERGKTENGNPIPIAPRVKDRDEKSNVSILLPFITCLLTIWWSSYELDIIGSYRRLYFTFCLPILNVHTHKIQKTTLANIGHCKEW